MLFQQPRSGPDKGTSIEHFLRSALHIGNGDNAVDEHLQEDGNPLGDADIACDPSTYGALVMTEQPGTLLLGKIERCEGSFDLFWGHFSPSEQEMTL